jgi:hypothetical protein
MKHHTVDKEYRDFADDIEAVSIHYLCAPNGVDADWESGRVTRFMPLVEPGVRRLSLQLPVQLVDPRDGRPVSSYTLFYYFEVFRGGDRHYSQVYTEAVEPAPTRATRARGTAHAAPSSSGRRSREV